MADPLTIAMVGTTVLDAAGSIAGGMAGSRQARARAGEAYSKALQLQQDAGQTRAASQRAALEQQRQAGIVNSRQLAIAAASGAGVGDTVMRLLAGAVGEGAYRSAVELYQGEAEARKMEHAASMTAAEGANFEQAAKESRRAGYFSAATSLARGAPTIMKGATSLYDKYFPKETVSKEFDLGKPEYWGYDPGWTDLNR